MGSFACGSCTKLELPRVELSGLGSAQPDEKTWTLARVKVAWALENYGGFEAVYDGIGAHLRDELLGRVVPEFFARPELRKLLNPSKIPYHGYFLEKEGFPFSSIQLEDPNSLTAIQDYANIIWPEGNSFFCNAALEYAVHMEELIQMIHKMILESLGLKDHHDSHMKSLKYSMRLSKYNDGLIFSTQKGDVVLPAHKDPNFISIISQHKFDGLEVETFDGRWIRVEPKPGAFIVLLGEAFMAWSNGRFQAPKHHVKMEGLETRYSMVYSTFPSQLDSVIEVPKKLADKLEHPLLFRPFDFYEYLKFRFSDEGEKHEDALKAYCGVESSGQSDRI
ncbi:Gibberellin 20 oxidase 1-B [Platanthera guangdongensis]|uniref:Gibberellin 20 oxidase 1-B n=1 Tax=Platanthera guangdongensis TaxID=2320717 RepID=A0ABR2LTQ7_9ASPA